MSDEPIVTTKENLAWFQTRRKSWQNAPRPKLKPLPPTRTIASGNDTTNSSSSSTTNTTRTTVTTDAIVVPETSTLKPTALAAATATPAAATTTLSYPTKNQSASIAAPGPDTAMVTPRRIVPRIAKGGNGFSANRSEGNNTALPSSNPFAGIQLIPSRPSVTLPTVSATASAIHLGAAAAESSSAGPDASSSPANEDSSRARLIAFYQKHNPEKLDSVDSTLLKFQGNEEELFRKLEAKYAATKPISSYPPPGGEGPTCFLKFSIGGKPPGTVTIKLYEDKVPLACQNFLALCTGSKGMGRMGQPLCYKNSKIHRVVPSFCVQAGDYTRGDGTGGESIFEPNTPGVSDSMGRFKDETFMRHSKKGLLSMANNGPNRNGSQFFFTLRPVVSLDGKHVVFGEVTSGLDVVVEQIGMLETTPREQPRESVVIVDCGEIVDGKEISCELGGAKTTTLPPFSIGTTVSSISPSPAMTFGAGSSTQPTPFSFGSISASLPIGDGFGSKTQSITENTTKGPSPFGFGANMNGGGSSLFSVGGMKSSIPTSGGAFGTQPTASSSVSKSSDQSKNLAAAGFGVAAGPSPALSFGALASGTTSSGVGFGGVSSSNSSAPSFGLGASASRPSIPFGSTTTATTTTTSTFSFGSLSNQVLESSFPSGIRQPSTASAFPSRTRPPIGDFRDGTLSGAESDSDDSS